MSDGVALCLRAAEASRASAPDPSAISAWCLRETARWTAARPSATDAMARMRAINEARSSYVLFAIAERRVSIVPKTTPNTLPGFIRRSQHYRDFLQAVVERDRLAIDVPLVMDIGDGTVTMEGVPFFAFQRKIGEAALLLPDIDFLVSRFYEADRYRDDSAFEGKETAAVFTGSTTGGKITMATVRDLSLPRLRAARYFAGNPDVAFDLPNITQCDTPETAAALGALGLPSRRRTWPEQFRHKFLLSMDGNGATCSRVVIALKSNSVLLKYGSPRELFYFSEMVPWRHYVPIAADVDVTTIVEAERRTPGMFRSVAEGGRDFADRHLTAAALFDYTSELLRRYAAIFA